MMTMEVYVSKSVSIAEAKARFAQCVRDAEHGETVVITRRGEVVAVMLAPEALAVVERARDQDGKGALLRLRDLGDLRELADEVERTYQARSSVRNAQGLG